MAWKIERWLAEVFPGKDRIIVEYRDLPLRELAVVAAASLDLALAELLSLRLADHGAECEGFLGLDGDGRAPAGSFGARIQLALLVGLISIRDAAVLRSIKSVRNLLAHRVKVDPTKEPALGAFRGMVDAFSAARPRQIIGSLHEISRWLPLVGDAAGGLLLAIFAVYQAYFHQMHARVERIGSALRDE